tara:strand:+ start:196 stop:444 length:249 start_codon:yes stop_codon:yes gene_type:complete
MSSDTANKSSELRSWVELMTGPFSALILSLSIIYAVGSYVPKVVDRHLLQIDKLIEQQEADRALYQRSLQEILIRLERIDER